MRTLLFAGIAFLTMGACATPASAWELIGTREVGDRTDHDTIHANASRLYDHIRLCVYRRPVHFYDVDVFFENGAHQQVSVRTRINPGGCTRAIDLEGGQRHIDHVSLVYEETSWRRRTATVRLYGE